VGNAASISTVLEKARKQGIKVVTWDADSKPESRDYFVNQATPEGIAATLSDEAAQVRSRQLTLHDRDLEDRRAGACRARDRLGNGMERHRSALDRGCGQAAAVDRHRVADSGARGRLGRTDDEGLSAAGVLRLHDHTELAHDPREHGRRVTTAR